MFAPRLQLPSIIWDVATISLFQTWHNITFSRLVLLCKHFILLGTIGILSTLIVWLLMASLSSRKFVSVNPEEQKSVVGRPLLFTFRMSHTRLHPTSNRFTYRILLAGIPVGVRGQIGALLALDRENPKSAGISRSLRAYWRHVWSSVSWFSFQSDRYLHRGDFGLNLEEKLHSYLRGLGEDPAQWPYAYLLSTPRFLWWSRNVVTWWYLYTPDRELDAMIMEINNSFREKRNMFFRVKGDSKPRGHSEKSSSECKDGYLDVRKTVTSVSSVAQSTFYRGFWERHIFTSPFEKVGGQVNVRFADPVDPRSWSEDSALSNATTVDESGQARIMMRLSCQGQPVDPISASSLEIMKLLFVWTIHVTLTTPRILGQALLFYWSGAMQMMSRPEIRKGSIPRDASQAERTLESTFRDYIEYCVSAYPKPVEVLYCPAKSLILEDVVMHSQLALKGPPGQHVPRLSMEPLTPEFYLTIAGYADASVGMSTEMEEVLNSEADVTSRRVWVSDPTLLLDVLEIGRKKSQSQVKASPTAMKFLRWLRGSPSSSFMDFFVFSSLPPSTVEVYIMTLARQYLADSVSLGSVTLLGTYSFVIDIGIRLSLFIGIKYLLSRYFPLSYDTSWGLWFGLTVLLAFRLVDVVKCRLVTKYLAWAMT